VFGCHRIDAEIAEGVNGGRHEAFAAGFVDGWTVRVSNGNGEASARCCNGRRETGRTGADDKKIRRVQQMRPFVIRSAAD
jgi:hypothetical protein